MNLRVLLSAGAAMAIGVAVAGCGQSTDGEAISESQATSESPATSADTGSTTAGPTTATSTTAGTSARVDPIAAIETAEADVDGVAYAIDDADGDGTREVTVRTGDTAKEVLIGADGAVVRVEDESLDDDDRQALDSAEITLADAITAALGATGGTLDDAEFDRKNGALHFEVTVDTDTGGDVDVRIDPVSGDVVSID